MPFRPVSTRFVFAIPRAYLVPIPLKFHVTPANIAYSCLGGFTVVVRPFQPFLRAPPEWLTSMHAVWHV